MNAQNNAPHTSIGNQDVRSPAEDVRRTPVSRAIAITDSTAAESWTSISQSAGPPTLNVVSGASGALRRTL